MERIAFILGETFIYWSSITLTLGVVVAIFLFLGFYLWKSGNALGAALAVPSALALSMFFSRLVHWYCQSDSYPGFLAAVTDYSSGGYALLGVFIGCLVAVCLLWLVFAIRNLPEMLDAMAVAAGAGIAVGRLASLFNVSDRGMPLVNFTELPVASAIINSVSGQTEYRLATFLLQAIAAAVIFVIVVTFHVVGLRKNHHRKDGDSCLLFLALYGASQIVLDSTRYDSLFLRSNGFVSIVQIACAVALVVPIVLFSVRLVRERGWKFWYLPFWVAIAGFLGGAGYMEYHVQRKAHEAVFAYSVMSACLLGTIIVMLVIRGLAVSAERKKVWEAKLNNP